MTEPEEKDHRRREAAEKEDEISKVEITSADEISPSRTEQIPVIKEKAAKSMALVLVIGYVFLVTLCFVYLFGGGTVADTVELIKTISAVLLGTVGVVLGYYFSKA